MSTVRFVGLTPQDLQVVRRLSQYRPFERGGASSREAQEDLILAAMAENEWSCRSVASCAEAIKTLFTVELDEVEVARALKQLMVGDHVRRNASGFQITSEERARLEQTAADSQASARRALDDWRGYLLDQWPGLSEPEVRRLESDLRVFLQHVVARHGAEATLALYPDDPEAEQRYRDLEDAGFSVLSEAEPAIEAIRDGALSHFVRRPSDAQRAYLSQILNTGYFLQVLTIDRDGARLVREQVSGQRVYADTNFVFRLLGIQGPRHVRPARTILDRTKDAGYEVCVTPWTIAEFRHSLDRARKYLHRYPVPPSEYAELLAEATSDDDFVTAYWRQVKDAPLGVDDFYANWAEVDLHLRELGILEQPEGCTAVDQRTDEITDQIAVLAKALHGRYRHPSLLEHDVKHRLLVERLRGTANRSFATAGYWFLTLDSVLPRYDFRARQETGGGLQFCVSAGAWFQIIEAFRPKTDDEGQALADLLASPYVRYRRTLSKEKAQQVVARVQMHEGGTPELAARVMMNSALVNEIEESTSQSEVATIDNAIVSAATQAHYEARQAQAIAQEERARADAAQREAALALEAARERAERDHADAEEKREEALRAQAARQAELLEREKELAEARRREQEVRFEAEISLAKDEAVALQESNSRTRRRLRSIVALISTALLAIVGVLAVGLDTVWAAVGIALTLGGVWALLERIWIRRA